MTRLVLVIWPRLLGISIVDSVALVYLSVNFFRSPKIVSHSMIFWLAASLFIIILLMRFFENSALVIAWLHFVVIFLLPALLWASKKWKWKIHQAHCEGYSEASFDKTISIVSLTASFLWPNRESSIWRALATLKQSSFNSSCRMYCYIFESSLLSWYSNQSSRALGKLYQIYLWPNCSDFV